MTPYFPSARDVRAVIEYDLDDDECLDIIMRDRYGKDLRGVCPKCGRETKYYRVSSMATYCCGLCLYQVSPKAGTLFAFTTVPLTTWFRVIHFLASHHYRISTKVLMRRFGLGIYTASKLHQRIYAFLDEHPFYWATEILNTVGGVGYLAQLVDGEILVKLGKSRWRKGVKVSCSGCGRIFYRPYSYKKRGEGSGKYCSSVCYNRNARTQTALVTKICVICESPYQIVRSSSYRIRTCRTPKCKKALASYVATQRHRLGGFTPK